MMPDLRQATVVLWLFCAVRETAKESLKQAGAKELKAEV